MKELMFGPTNVAGAQASLAAQVALRFPDGVEGEGSLPGVDDEPNYTNFSQNTYGASFAEVSIDAATGEVRAASHARRIRRQPHHQPENRPLATARRYDLGHQFGSSRAAQTDLRYGNFVNADLAEYLVPVHADIPDRCGHAWRLRRQGQPARHQRVGELDICGTGAAVANAASTRLACGCATSPITMDKLLKGLPADA